MGANWTSVAAVDGGIGGKVDQRNGGGWAAEVLLGGLVGRAGPAVAMGGWPWRRAGDGRRRKNEMGTNLSEL